jgi:hypothetical protein
MRRGGGGGLDELGVSTVFTLLHCTDREPPAIVWRLWEYMVSTFLLFLYIILYARVAQSLQCLGTGWTTGRSRFDPRQRRQDSSSSLCVQTDSGAHPAFCTMGTGGPILGGKARPRHDADHSPPSTAEVKNE